MGISIHPIVWQFVPRLSGGLTANYSGLITRSALTAHYKPLEPLGPPDMAYYLGYKVGVKRVVRVVLLSHMPFSSVLWLFHPK